MDVYFKPSFIRDFKKLPSDTQREVRYICTELFPSIRDMKNLFRYQIKPIGGFKNYFRIRVGNYRIGFKRTSGGIVEFMRVKYRKDIYRNFP